MEKGLISVIIPCFNQGHFINEAVDSILNQTYQNFEIIIINDGSTDKFTNDFLKEFKAPKTKIFFTKNQGLANTRNFGFNMSKGEYIQFLDADDFLKKDKFESHITGFDKEKNIDISYSDYCYFNDKSKEYSSRVVNIQLSNNPYHDFLYKWQRGLSIPIHTALFKRKIWLDKNPFISNFGAIEDWIMWVMLSKAGNKFKFINKDLAVYRIQEKNMTKDRDFMFYWVARAIGYIADNVIDKSKKIEFDNESTKYIKKIVNNFWIDSLEYENKSIKTELVNIEYELNKKNMEIKNLVKSKTYKVGETVLWFPKKIKKLLDINK